MTTELKNLYEEIIQDAISEGINGMTPELKRMIKSAPVELRRSMLLDIWTAARRCRRPAPPSTGGDRKSVV